MRTRGSGGSSPSVAWDIVAATLWRKRNNYPVVINMSVGALLNQESCRTRCGTRSVRRNW